MLVVHGGKEYTITLATVYDRRKTGVQRLQFPSFEEVMVGFIVAACLVAT